MALFGAEETRYDSFYRGMAAADCSRRYLSCTARDISSLRELKPGDHIRVRGELGETIDTSIKDLKIYTHHMLVVRVVSDSEIVVIHKTQDGVLEEERSYRPDEITVLDYESPYTGEKAIQRARERMDQSYNLFFRNCEHFVTEVRTGEKISIQVRTGVTVAGAAVVTAGVIGGLWYAFSHRESDSDPDSED